MVSLASYRGPGMAGGVSTALATLWKAVGNNAQNWYYVCSKTDSIKKANGIAQTSLESWLDPQLIKAHYHYCNDFIWPVMHDLPEFVQFRRQDRERYAEFNRQFASVIESNRRGVSSTCFIQDYQLALVSRNFGGPKQIFWHIPWPKNVLPEHLEQIREIAEGLLQCDSIGFHTREYADNFVNFVTDNFPELSSAIFRREANRLQAIDGFAGSSQKAWRSARVRGLVRNNFTQKVSRIIVAPLGLDLEYWQGNSRNSMRFDDKLADLGLHKHSYVLSVDRADYTKGVHQRLMAIDTFFSRYPHWQGLTKFVQICGKTRAGLQAFDKYWQECRRLADSINRRWGNDDWEPVVWIDTPMNAEMLAGCYRNALVMLVNPVRDGLNLTAKEFIACQDENPGVLALSPGAGAWDELGDHAVDACPSDVSNLADTIESCLRMNREERLEQTRKIMDRLEDNTLDHWCRFFSGHAMAPSATPSRKQVSFHRRIKTGRVDTVFAPLEDVALK